MQYILEVLVAYVGSSVERNIKQISVILSQILTDFELHKDLETAMQNFIMRCNHRDNQIKNEFFVINWKLLANVSHLIPDCNAYLVFKGKSFSDNINHHNIFDNHKSIWTIKVWRLRYDWTLAGLVCYKIILKYEPWDAKW